MAPIFILLLLVFMPDYSSAALDTDISAVDKKLLQMELALAKKDRIYAVFNLREKRVQVKAKGLLLKDLPVASIRVRNSDVGVQQIVLAKKVFSDAPARPEIVPGAKSDASDIKALELDDMPTNYILRGEGIELFVIACSPSSWVARQAWVKRQWYLLRWQFTTLSSRITELWTKRELWTKGRLSYVQLQMAEKDARMVYWYLPEGTEVLIVPAGTN